MQPVKTIKTATLRNNQQQEDVLCCGFLLLQAVRTKVVKKLYRVVNLILGFISLAKEFKKIPGNMEILIICEKQGTFQRAKLELKSVKNGNVVRGTKLYYHVQDTVVQLGKKILSSLDEYFTR